MDEATFLKTTGLPEIPEVAAWTTAKGRDKVEVTCAGVVVRVTIDQSDDANYDTFDRLGGLIHPFVGQALMALREQEAQQ